MPDHPTDDNPDPDVRADVGGWISGPCLPPGGEVSRGLYWAQVEAEDSRLDAILASIRRRQDEGTITTREAADERVVVLETHLASVRQLRQRYLGGS